MEIEVESGDLFLVSRPCHKMDMMSMAICYGAKVVGNSDWDHLGIVVEDPHTKELHLLEANLSGVSLYPLKDRILRSKASLFAVRKLLNNPGSPSTSEEGDGTEKKEALWRLAKRYHNKKYNDSFLQMAAAAVSSYKSFLRQWLGLAQEERLWQAKVNTINRHLESRAKRTRRSLLDRAMIAVKRELIDQIADVERQLAQLAAQERAIAEQKEEKKPQQAVSEVTTEERYFCSQLVAEVLMDLLSMSKDRQPHHYLPADFSSGARSAVLADAFRASQYRHSCDLVVRQEDIDSIEPLPGKLKITLALPKAGKKIRFGLNKGDLLPAEIARQLVDLPPSCRLQVSGDIHVLSAAHPSDVLDTQDVQVLGVLRKEMDSQAILLLLRLLREKHKDIYLQAEHRSSLTISHAQTTPTAPFPTAEEVALQQQALLAEEVWRIVWPTICNGDLSYFHGIEHIDIPALATAILRQPPSARELHRLNDTWETFLKVIDLESVVLRDPFHPKQHPVPRIEEIVWLFLLFEEFVSTNDEETLFLFFVDRFVHKYHRHHSLPQDMHSVDRLVRRIMSSAQVWKGKSCHEDKGKSSDQSQWMQILPAVALPSLYVPKWWASHSSDTSQRANTRDRFRSPVFSSMKSAQMDGIVANFVNKGRPRLTRSDT
eukprot:scaffold50_cov162-Ochromonas_danica.AAC.18